MNEDIIETLRRIQCSDVACGNLRIAMGLKLAIYEIERLRAERDDASGEIMELQRKLKATQKELSNYAMDRIAKFDEENGL